MSIVVLNHAVVSTHIASLHREGCRDIEREQLAHASNIYGPFDTVEAALSDYLDEEMIEMGYGPLDVKVHPCCKR